jgi:hypothetical protein
MLAFELDPVMMKNVKTMCTWYRQRDLQFVDGSVIGRFVGFQSVPVGIYDAFELVNGEDLISMC